jgi:hypothetical protein
MSYFAGTVSHSTTGVKTITCGFQPTRARITITKGTASTNLHQSVGKWDGTNQITDTIATDGVNAYSDRFTDRMAALYNFVAGLPNLLTRVNHDSVTATEYKYNVITANVNCQLLIELWN